MMALQYFFFFFSKHLAKSKNNGAKYTNQYKRIVLKSLKTDGGGWVGKMDLNFQYFHLFFDK